MDYTSEINKIKDFVIAYLNAHTNDTILYHDIEHTIDVVEAAHILADHNKLNEKENFIVTTACWFHDTGYFNGSPIGHEQRSADTAISFLKGEGVPEDIINEVKNCILATRMPQQPATLLEQIVCDADLSHLASADFFKRNKLLRKEIEALTQKKISKEEWRKSTLGFLESYHFHTAYGKTVLEAGKQRNITALKEKIAAGENNLSKEIPAEPAAAAIVPPQNTIVREDDQPSAKDKKKKSDRPERGIETMFRISSSNHQRLSDMADNKAHIMITTTSIIISVVLSVLLRKLEDNPHLIIPVILLLLVCVITMVFCILATRPSVPHGTFTQEDIKEKKVNLLFFGNFYRMSLDQYADGVNKMMNDREFLYGSLTRDIYAQGVVLGKKYNLLRIGYSIFMFGIVVSVLAFIIATIFFGFD
ncbi:MAG: DUF5706 domain-containing protein [Niabella sp.]